MSDQILIVLILACAVVAGLAVWTGYTGTAVVVVGALIWYLIRSEDRDRYRGS